MTKKNEIGDKREKGGDNAGRRDGLRPKLERLSLNALGIILATIMSSGALEFAAGFYARFSREALKTGERNLSGEDI